MTVLLDSVVLERLVGAFGLQLVPKRSSALVRAIAFLMKPFWPDWLDHGAMNLGATTYVSQDLLDRPGQLWPVAGHEGVHRFRADRAWGGPWMWRLRYLFPAPLGVLGLLAALVGAFWSSWWLLALVVAAAGFAPWPSSFRVREEVLAEGLAIALRRWRAEHNGYVFDAADELARSSASICGAGYWFPVWTAAGRAATASELGRAYQNAWSVYLLMRSGARLTVHGAGEWSSAVLAFGLLLELGGSRSATRSPSTPIR